MRMTWNEAKYDSILKQILVECPPSIGVDLDGTLVESSSYKSWDYVGPIIKRVVDRVLEKEKEGYVIKIFTARAYDERCIPVIKKHLRDNGLPEWEVTNVKDPSMVEIWDDRAIRVERNTGVFKD